MPLSRIFKCIAYLQGHCLTLYFLKCTLYIANPRKKIFLANKFEKCNTFYGSFGGGRRERRRYTMLILILKSSEKFLPKIWVNSFWPRLSQTHLIFYQYLTSHRKNALWKTLGNTGLDKFSQSFSALISSLDWRIHLKNIILAFILCLLIFGNKVLHRCEEVKESSRKMGQKP